MKKYEIGLSPFISPKEYDYFFSLYSDYIDYIYYSVPLGPNFQTRIRLYQNMSFRDATSYLIEVFSVIKKYNIKTQLCLNANQLNENDVKDALIYSESILGHVPDAVVSLKKYTDTLLKYYKGYYIYSFNNGVRTLKDLDDIPECYQEIVVIPSSIQDFDLWKAATKKGVKVRLLLNNGCSPNCLSCQNNKFCRSIFDSNVTRYGINYVYATQSLFPTEFKQLIESNPYISAFKISNRTSNFKYLVDCFTGYFQGNDFVSDTFSFYHWSRLGHFVKYYNSKELDLKEIYNIKYQKWENKYDIKDICIPDKLLL